MVPQSRAACNPHHVLAASAAVSAESSVENHTGDQKTCNRSENGIHRECCIARVKRFCEEPGWYIHGEEDRNNEGKKVSKRLTNPATRVACRAAINFHWISGKVGDIEPEVIQRLIPSEPNACRRKGNHQTVKNDDSAQHIHRVEQHLYRVQ